MDDAFKEIFETELTHLKTQADQFARDHKYRRLASKVGLDPNAELRDPFVDWLLQGYAFLAARVQDKVDSGFPRFTQNLLSVVNPQLMSPTPSMIVAGFSMRGEPALMSGPVLPRGHRLDLAARVENSRRGPRNVTFTTGRALRLFPIEVTGMRYLPDAAALESAGVNPNAPAGVMMTLSLTADAPFHDFPSDNLDLHVSNSDGLGAVLFEALALCGCNIEVHGTERRRGSSAAPTRIVAEPLGFDREFISEGRGREIDALLPYDARSFDGYRLLHEFFALPDRFHFLRLGGLKRAFEGKSEREVRIVFLLPRPFPGLNGKLGPESVRTNCVPAVNLFEKDTEISGKDALRQTAHRVVPDRGDPTGYEVHSVLSVVGRTDGGDEQVFRPFFSVPGLGEALDGPGRYFALNRVARMEPADLQRAERDRSADLYRGTEVDISLVDDAAVPVTPDLKALFLRVLCTNRHLPLYAAKSIGANADLRSGEDLGWDRVRIVAGPSWPRPGLQVGRKLWDAVNHLSLNYLSLIEQPGPDPVAPLRSLMKLYLPESPPRAANIANSLRGISTGQIVKPIDAPPDMYGRATPVTFARGLHIGLTFSAEMPEASTLAAILDRFFASFVSANNFTRTTMYPPEGPGDDPDRDWRLRWPARTGSRTKL